MVTFPYNSVKKLKLYDMYYFCTLLKSNKICDRNEYDCLDLPPSMGPGTTSTAGCST